MLPTHQEGNHRQTSVLELCLLQLEGAGVITGGQTQGVKVAACTPARAKFMPNPTALNLSLLQRNFELKQAYLPPAVIPTQKLKRNHSMGRKRHTWVDASSGFELAVAVDLSTTDQDGLDPNQLADGEGQVEAQVLGTIQLHLASIHPVDIHQSIAMYCTLHSQTSCDYSDHTNYSCVHKLSRWLYMLVQCGQGASP